MNFQISQTENKEDLASCAHMMSESDPWLTLGRDYAACLRSFTGPNKEVYVMTENDRLMGFAILQMAGTFRGYVQTLFISPDVRGRGMGTFLLKFCEEEIFHISPNVFLCVSSFNEMAEKLYKLHGYERIGVIKDFITRGYDEILYRKTIGPSADFVPKK